MKATIAAIVLAAAAAVPVAAADTTVGRSLAATCTGCHGTNGRSEGAIPSLAGLQKAYIANAMRAFKGGTREATVMHQHANGYSDEQIERLAEFFAAQKLD